MLQISCSERSQHHHKEAPAALWRGQAGASRGLLPPALWVCHPGNEPSIPSKYQPTLRLKFHKSPWSRPLSPAAPNSWPQKLCEIISAYCCGRSLSLGEILRQQNVTMGDTWISYLNLAKHRHGLPLRKRCYADGRGPANVYPNAQNTL